MNIIQPGMTLYFAGFGPKFLMELLYLPALAMLVVASIIIYFMTKKGRPYTAYIVLLSVVGLLIYLKDKLFKVYIPLSQRLLLCGVIAVLVVLAVASSGLVPEKSSAVNGMAALGNILALIFVGLAIKYRNY